MTRSLMLVGWEGGGSPHDTDTVTYSGDPAYVKERALAWIERWAADEPAAVPISDVPLGLWPMLEDFEEDLTDAAA